MKYMYFMHKKSLYKIIMITVLIVDFSILIIILPLSLIVVLKFNFVSYRTKSDFMDAMKCIIQGTSPHILNSLQ